MQYVCILYIHPKICMLSPTADSDLSVPMKLLMEGVGGKLQTKISDPAKYQAKSEISQTLKVADADNKTL